MRNVIFCYRFWPDSNHKPKRRMVWGQMTLADFLEESIDKVADVSSNMFLKVFDCERRIEGVV